MRWIPNAPSVFPRSPRKQALTRSLLILAAWQDAGRDPAATPADLGLTQSTVTDPYDGSQLRVKATGETIAIYSVGENLADDGGSVASGNDVGIQLANIASSRNP